MVLMARSEDEEVIRMLLNDLEYSRRVRTAAVVYARFVSLSSPLDEAEKATKITAFKKVRKELLRLGEVRNALVHSRYFSRTNVNGKLGLIRIHSQLQGGERNEEEHEMLPETFAAEHVALSGALAKSEQFRLQIINWIFPDVQRPYSKRPNETLVVPKPEAEAVTTCLISFEVVSSKSFARSNFTPTRTKPHAHSPAAANAHAPRDSENAVSKYSG